MTDTNKEREAAEQWLRNRYGAYRGHFAWRELEEAFLAGRASLAASAPAPLEHIKEPYTLAEIKAKIASNDYSAELMLQHAMLHLDRIAASAGNEPVTTGSIDHLKLMMEASAWDGQLQLSDALANIDDFSAAHPSPPEGMAGWLQVYRCKIKSRKQIDKEIPREQQGWWADVAAGQKLLLRQAVQSDIDRCTLGGKRSRNPGDYMCETHTNGSLVSKVALEYMNPEENVFAAAPPASEAKGAA